MAGDVRARQFLDPAVVARLGTLELRARTIVEGFLTGLHRSPFKGFSVEFAEYRQYIPGDDLSTIDWKVYARSDRHYVKKFEEETNLDCHIMLDVSGSMGYGSIGHRTKYTYACQIAAALGYIVSKERDSLGVTIYDNEVRQHIPARSGKRHLGVVLDRLAAHTPQHRTDTGQALHMLAEMVSRRGMIVLISDLFDDASAVFNALAHFRKKMHDVILLQVLDPVELDLSIDRMAEFIDMETGEKLEIDPSSARLAYKQELQKLIDECREKCSVLNVDYRLVSTDQSFEDFVHQYLMERRRMSL